MSETVPRRSKEPPTESDLSQVLAQGPAFCEAYGPRLGALIMILAISKTRRGYFGITAGVSILGSILYHLLLK